MPNRLFSLLMLSAGTMVLYAAAPERELLEVSAASVHATKTTLDAEGGIMVYYQDAVIRADTAHYDKAAHRLILDGHVEMIGYKGTKEEASHIEIDTQQKQVTFKELFFASENDLWLLTNEADRTDGNYTFGSSMLSSCEMEDPLWTMFFSRSLYDSQAKYMQVYDASIYFKDIPVFYMPYLAFSTDNQRSSGLLFPLFGYTENEGLVYEQPFFWAINESMDLEFNPQIRTKRSVGIYATYRFADSPYSSGAFRLGYFKDKDSYARKYDLPEDQHYGLEFLYDSSKVFSTYLPESYTDGLYANVTLLNDIDYLNLQKTALSHFGQVPLQESRVNYFLYNDDWYGGLNAKYFIDTRLKHNDTTLQTLPSLQLHKYLKSLIWDELTYSVDLQMKHLERKTGPTLNQAEIRLPLTYTASLFDDYLNLSLGEVLYFGRFFFGNDDTLVHDYFQYNSNVHQAKLYSDLTRHYDGFIHVFQPSVRYTKPGNESEKPVSFKEVVKDEEGNVRSDLTELFSVGLPEEELCFSLSHYFYSETMELIFFQRLSQSYFPDREYEMAELNNEMQYNWGNWKFYNNLYYSYEFDRISESSTRIVVNEEGYDMSLGHTYKKQLSEPGQPVTSNDLNFDFNYDYNEHIALNGGLTYNIEEESSKLWRIGAAYKEDCWSLMVQLRTDVLPRPTADSGEHTSTQEYGFVFQLNFIPFASIGSGGGS
jgi:LPS-assembly protein